MNRAHRTVTTFVLASLTVVAPALAASAEKSEEISWDISPGTVVAVSTINGDIRVRRSEDGKLTVRAVKRATGSDSAQVKQAVERVKIAAEKSKGRLKIEADIPSDIKGGGLLSAIFGKDVTVTVNYDLRIPEGCDLDADSVNGEVDALGLYDDVALKSVNGSIVIAEHAGAINAETVNGAISIDIAKPLRGGKIIVSTVNGAIDLSLPEGSEGDVHAETLNGSIRTDFDLEVSRRMVGSELDGRLGRRGEGGAHVSIESMNGAIRVNRLEPSPAPRGAAANGRDDTRPAKDAGEDRMVGGYQDEEPAEVDRP